MALLFLGLAHREGTAPVRAWPLALFAVVIALAMLTAAIPKVMTGWLDPGTHAVFSHTVNNAIFNERQTPAWELAIQRLPPPAWELLDDGTVVLESSFIIAVARRRAFLMICAVACLFHLGVVMLMRIVFLLNTSHIRRS